MKKIPLLLKILIPVSLIAVAAFVFFLVKYSSENKLYTKTIDEVNAILAEEPDMKSTDYSEEKRLTRYSYIEHESTLFSYAYSTNEDTYQYENIEFVSFSKDWDSDDLKDLCEELLKNEHGNEIEELDAVAVYDDSYSELPFDVWENRDLFIVPMALFQFFPQDYAYHQKQAKNVLSLYNADIYKTVQDQAYQLSYAYGSFFVSRYFDLYADDETVESDPYFKLRYNDDLNYDIIYKQVDYDDWNEYAQNSNKYLLHIAADDYVYLMGSPMTKRKITYMDTQEILRLDVKDKNDEMDEYYDLTIQYSFNETPHGSVFMPMPDKVDGLAELFFEQIGSKPPKYSNHGDKAQDIKLEVKKSSNYGKKFCIASWEKPWKDEEVTYTLVAYDKDDKIIGAIKSIDGTQRSRAIFGGAVIDISSTQYSWYDEDYWKEQGFLRLRVVVTFSDGTAVVSPAVDWSFE